MFFLKYKGIVFYRPIEKKRDTKNKAIVSDLFSCITLCHMQDEEPAVDLTVSP